MTTLLGAQWVVHQRHHYASRQRWGSDQGRRTRKAKQLMGHAIDEQQSSMAIREGRFLWGQQSCMRSVEEMCDMSTDFTLIAAPLPVGSMATDKATKRIRMVRPMCMGPPALAK